MPQFDKQNREPSFAFPIILLVLLIASIVGCFFVFKPEPAKTRNVPSSFVHDIKRDTLPILIVFTDTTDDGRPMYSVFLPDSTGLDCMYPEEIAESLNKGKWQYNEDLRVQ